MKFRFLCLLIFGSILLTAVNASVITINPPTTGSQLFFDDFTTGQYSDHWSYVQGGSTQTFQQNGYMTQVDSPSTSINFLIANLTGPAWTTVIPESVQFRQLTFRLQPFNISTVGTAIYETEFGFGTNGTATLSLPFSHGIYFQTLESVGGSLRQVMQQFSLAKASNYPLEKTAIFLNINRPMASATNSYTMTAVDQGTFPSIRYDGPGARFDLNAPHIFTIQTQLDKGNDTNNYVRFQVDNNGWMTFYQSECSCLVGSTGDILPLYPFVEIRQPIITAGLGLTNSVSVQTDYVLLTDYTPSSLPSGQLLSSNINPPLHNQGIYQPGGFSLTQYVQFQANEIGQGNIYAGGLFLTGIFMLIITLGLAGVMWKTRMGLAVFGMIWNISTLAFIYLMFYTGVIPLLIPVLVTIGAAAILFGIFRSGPPSIGGEVSS